MSSTTQSAQLFAGRTLCRHGRILTFTTAALLGIAAASAQAQTLTAGDVIILQMNPSTTDSLVVMPLINLNAGTTFTITDNGWLSSSGDGFRTGEGLLTFTTPSGGVRAGTLLKYLNNTSISSGFSGLNPTNFALNASNDSLIIVSGATVNGTTPISSVIYGLQSDANSPYAWDSSASNAQTSARPQLADTNLTPVLQGVNGFYSGTTTGASSATWIARAATTGNWTYSASEQPQIAATSYGVISNLTWTGSTTTWDPATSVTNWQRSGTNTWFNQSDNVTFGTTGVGPVAVVAGGVSPGTITFAADGYTLQSSTVTLGSTSTIEVTSSGHNATISSTLAGSNGLTKTGAGTLTLDGTNNYTGTTTLSGGTLALNSGKTLSQAGSTVVVTITGNNTTLTNAGTITQTGTGRAIDVGTANLNITVNNSGSINSVSTDAFRVNADSAVSLTNSGTIAVSAGGQAIDWAAISTRTNSLTNQLGGIISAVGEDAVRPGRNGVVNNAGTISATPTGGPSPSGSDGIDLRTLTGIQITNTGTISGRHGIATDGANMGPSSLTVNNNAGTIQAVNGSGINVDGVNTSVTANVTNAAGATIKGGVLAAATDGDGDGIDVDGVLTLNNSGSVLGLGAKGGTNNAEGVAAGGGSVTNTTTGQIVGSTLAADAPNGDTSKAGNGILIDDSNGGNAVAATTVTNSGLIQGKTGFGIKLIGNFADTITNNAGGTIRGAGTGATLQTGDGGDTVTNRGAITSDIGNAIDLEAGDDLLQIEGGAASITGSISGGTGTNSFTLDPGTSNTFAYSGTISNFSSVTVQSGTVSLSGANTFAGATTVSAGALEAAAAGALGSANGITVNSGGTLLLSGAGLLDRVNNSASLTVGGTVARTGTASEGSGAILSGGTPTGTNAVGLGALTLSSTSTLDFEVGSVGTLVFSGFTPGAFTLDISGYSNSTFDGLLNSGTATDDRLIFSIAGGLSVAQLGSINFGSGLSAGQIALGGDFFEVGVVPVPEPSAMLVALGMFGLAGWREGRRSQVRRRTSRLLSRSCN